MLGELVSAFSIWDRVSKFWKSRNDIPIEAIAARFVRLFENHGVNRNQIPGFFGHGLTVANFKDDETLLAVLSEDRLNAVCELFAVRREWLDGADDQIYPLHHFYKWPEKFVEFILHLNKREDANLSGVLIVAESSSQEDALIILEETIGCIGDKPIYRYHICDDWIFKYWKSRAYLTACIAQAWKHKIYIMGREVSADLVDRYKEGLEFLEYGYHGALPTGGLHWHPEDMADNPDVYLKGVDPEIRNYGVKSALNLWLELAQKGLMDTCFGSAPTEVFNERLLIENKNKKCI